MLNDKIDDFIDIVGEALMNLKIKDYSKKQIEEFSHYYDRISVGICIQKLFIAEDGIPDLIPIYANNQFGEFINAPVEYMLKTSLRKLMPNFPINQIEEMKEVALEGRFLDGESFSVDGTKYFSVHFYQFSYGYVMTMLTDVTAGHINENTLHGVSRAYEEIYYVRTQGDVCSMVYPEMKHAFQKLHYEELITKYIASHDIYHEDRSGLEQFLKKEEVDGIIVDDECVSYKFRMANAGKEYRWHLAEIIINEIVDNTPVAYIIAIKDIDDIVSNELEKQQELEEAYKRIKKANDSKDKFMAHMSHDLRTPLNGILGMIQILEERDLPEKVRLNYCGKIRKATENLLTLFNEVLDITRIETTDITEEKKSFDLRILKNSLLVFVENQDVEFKVDFPDPAHPIRIGTEEYIRQVVLQLVTNAVKYNKDNNPIEVSVKESKNSDEVILVVKDHGIGMSDEFQEQMFEPFAQEDADSRTIYEGYGLGLTYVTRIINALDGRMEVYSEKGKGTTFVVALDLEIDADRELEIEKATRKVDLKGKKILLVEDNEVNMMITECFIETEGMIPYKAQNGKIAVEMFTESDPGTYDLILMDIMMPVMNGLDATEAIRNSNHPDAKNIPIIAISANCFPEDIEKGKAVGMNDYLSKPLSMPALFAAIEKHI